MKGREVGAATLVGIGASLDGDIEEDTTTELF